MRWLFILLLMANGFYAFWHYTAVEPVREPSPPEPVDAAPLVLLGEALPERPVAGEEPSDPATLPPEAVVSCWELSPFAVQALADEAAAALEEAGFTVQRSTIAIPGAPVYWVYVGPYESREAALAARRDIRGRGIDSFVITEGELVDSISLGVFSREELARNAQRQYRRQIDGVQVRRLERSTEGWSLWLEGPVVAEHPGRVLQRLPDFAGSEGDIAITKKSCN
jgi:hypothetical protein